MKLPDGGDVPAADGSCIIRADRSSYCASAGSVDCFGDDCDPPMIFVGAYIGSGRALPIMRAGEDAL